MEFKYKVVCEGCDTQSATLIMADPTPLGFRVLCDCGWNEPVEGLDEFFWYLSEALNTDENSLIAVMISHFMS